MWRVCHHWDTAMPPLSHGLELLMTTWKDGVQASRGGSGASPGRVGGTRLEAQSSILPGRMWSDLK